MFPQMKSWKHGIIFLHISVSDLNSWVLPSASALSLWPLEGPSIHSGENGSERGW